MFYTFGKHADGLAVYEFVITHKILLWIVQKSWANLNYERNDKIVENSTRSIETTGNF